jgi:hypothetical protein
MTLVRKMRDVIPTGLAKRRIQSRIEVPEEFMRNDTKDSALTARRRNDGARRA